MRTEPWEAQANAALDTIRLEFEKAGFSTRATIHGVWIQGLDYNCYGSTFSGTSGDIRAGVFFVPGAYQKPNRLLLVRNGQWQEFATAGEVVEAVRAGALQKPLPSSILQK